MKARFVLKSATEDFHRELDDRMSSFNLAEATDYRRFLQIHARAVPPIEAALAAGGLGDLIAGWSDGRRADAIQNDLKALGETMPVPSKPPSIDGIGELLGTAYVLEGSRLGGRMLRQQVGESLPTRFLGEEHSVSPWPALIAAMDEHLHSDAQLDEAKHAARRCFALYLDVAREVGI